MTVLDKSAMQAKVAEKQALRQARVDRHTELKIMIDKHDLQFTYIRNMDDEEEGGEPYQHGGAVVCWKMPEKPGTRMLEVSIAWCHDNERFDKMEGRYRAAKNYLDGKCVLFKLLPGDEGMSDKLKEVFTNGFVV